LLIQIVTSIYKLQSLIKQYPTRFMAGVAVSLSLMGGAAVAVVHLAPDESSLGIKQVFESVSTPSLSSAKSAEELMLYRTETTRSSDSAESLLARLGVNNAQAANFLRGNTSVRQQILGRAGRVVTAKTDAQQRLIELTARWSADDRDQFSRLSIKREGESFSQTLENVPFKVTTRLASGTIQTSLYAATDDANIPDAVANQIASIFSGDIDFQRGLRKGDRFSVVFESLEADGEALRTGRVVSAEFVNAGKTLQAFWFEEPGSKGGYYNAEGRSLRHAYLASPLTFSRITSGFKMRFHPILQTWKAHLGVDYGAPQGTPILSVGNGIVDFAGVQGGYGNVVIIKHNNQNTTLYAHMSKINVKRGQSITQGQTLGLVGATGWATGPHLHFEFRVNGKQKDPLSMARESVAVEVSAAARAAFKQQIARSQSELAVAATLQNGSAE
jgi:murein DD-endopeptidase MepM/ murein hydrolase activator NlpD